MQLSTSRSTDSIKRQKNEYQSKLAVIAFRFASSRAPPRCSLIDLFAILFVSVRVFPISQNRHQKGKEKKIHYTYISKCKEFLAPYGAIAVIAIYNLIRNRLISPIIIRARLELDLIKSCVCNTKDQFRKSVYDASPMYSCVYPYMYIYIIFFAHLYIYIYFKSYKIFSHLSCLFLRSYFPMVL